MWTYHAFDRDSKDLIPGRKGLDGTIWLWDAEPTARRAIGKNKVNHGTGLPLRHTINEGDYIENSAHCILLPIPANAY